MGPKFQNVNSLETEGQTISLLLNIQQQKIGLSIKNRFRCHGNVVKVNRI
jgi:hypothetical protein